MKQITRIEVKNFLSLRAVEITLNRLNVLVGPNGSGKSNLLNVLKFLGEIARTELGPAVRAMGGMDELFYKGRNKENPTIEINIQGIITKFASVNAPDSYKIAFRGRPGVRRSSGTEPLHRQSDVYYRVEELKFKRYRGPGKRITLTGGKVTVDYPNTKKSRGEIQTEKLDIENSATGLGTLRRLSDGFGAKEWDSFAEIVEDLRLFEINVDRCRAPSVGRASPRLLADASNLAVFLQWLAKEHPVAFDDLCDDVRFVLPTFQEFRFTSIGGADDATRLDIVERHLTQPIPLARASFGTMRAIALFAMLHDPNPPALTCIEEIDHGMHPHALDRIVERLRDASERTQIIVATHSPSLVNRLETSDLIIVERDFETDETKVFRPKVEFIEELRKETDFGLGELWFSGAIGGGL